MLFNFFALFLSISSCLGRRYDSSALSCDFKSPDLTTTFMEDEHLIVLEAYKSLKNMKNLLELNNSTKGSLRWYSLGNPRLVAMNGNIFHFTSELSKCVII